MREGGLLAEEALEVRHRDAVGLLADLHLDHVVVGCESDLGGLLGALGGGLGVVGLGGLLVALGDQGLQEGIFDVRVVPLLGLVAGFVVGLDGGFVLVLADGVVLLGHRGLSSGS